MATNKIVNKDYLERQFYRYNSTIVAPQFQTLNTSAGNKVDKAEGYALSKNDFSDTYKSKLLSLENYKDDGNDGSTIKELIQDNTDDIATLNGDGAGSVKQIVNTRVAELVGGDTLTHESLGDMATWISGHVTSAEGMEDDITKNEEDIATLKQRVADASYEYETDDINFDDVATISLTGNDTVEVGKDITLTSTVSGVTWKSSDDGKATVVDGVVHGVSEGEVTITASLSGYKSATKVITVTAAGV